MYSQRCFYLCQRKKTTGSLLLLLYKKGYIFLGSNLLRTNAFFILKRLQDKINLDLPKINNLDNHVDSHVRESRNKNGELNFLAGKDRIKEIKNCEVVDLSNSEKKLY